MKILGRVCAALTIVVAAAFLLPAQVFAQGTVLQSGPWVPGHAPMYIGSGGNSQATLFDSGPAGGAAIGYGLSEKLLQARGPGTGPDGTHDCDWSTYSSNPAGAYFLCFDPNALGIGLLDFGAVGPAAPTQFGIKINGTIYYPATAGSATVPPGFVSITAPPFNACPEGSPGYQPTPVDPAGRCDATAAINAAIASGQNVYIPAGAYHVTNQLLCSGYGQVIEGAGRTQSVIDVGSDFNMSANAVLALAPPTGMNPNFETECELRDVGLRFYQNSTDTSRAQLIQYPYAISGVNGAALHLNNVRMINCWNGINMTGNTGLFRFMGMLELGCFNQNLYIDGPLGYSHINSLVVSPNYGYTGGSFASIWEDGNTQAAFISRIDGLDISKFSSFYGATVIGPNNQLVTGVTIGVMDLNGDGATVQVQAGALSVGAFTGSQGAGAYGPQIEVNDTTAPGPDNARVNIGTLRFAGSGTAPFDVTSGTLVVGSGVVNMAPNTTAFKVETTNAEADLHGISYVFNNTANRTVPLIWQVNGTLVADDQVLTSSSGGHTGPIVEIDTDQGRNRISGIQNLATWGATSVTLGFSTTLGYYDFGNLEFPITSTPAFATEGDFAPTGNTVLGGYFLMGNDVEFQLNDEWTNNAYTTASGAFALLTNLPAAIGPGGSKGAPISISEIDNVTLPTPPSAICSAIINGVQQIALTVCNSAGVATQLGTANLPPSRANLQIVVGGRYRVR